MSDVPDTIDEPSKGVPAWGKGVEDFSARMEFRKKMEEHEAEMAPMRKRHLEASLALLDGTHPMIQQDRRFEAAKSAMRWLLANTSYAKSYNEVLGGLVSGEHYAKVVAQHSVQVADALIAELSKAESKEGT